MAFPKPVPPNAVAIGDISMTVAESRQIMQPLTPLVRTFLVNVQRLDSSGKHIDMVTFDIQPHLTAAQLNGLNNLLDNIRTHAAAELL